MKIYCKDKYKSFKKVMETTFDAVYGDVSKKGFNAGDVLVLQIFSLALDELCADLMKSINEREEEDE